MGKDAELFIGLDLGGTNIQGGVVDAGGQILARDKTKTKAEEGQQKVIKRLGKIVDDLLDKVDAKASDVVALGIGAPGAIDVDRGLVWTAPNLGWSDFPLAETLQDQLGMSVVVDNDVNVGVWGEYKGGAGRGVDDLIGIFVGTGIGAGLILGGQIFHGPRLTAGEIGHTIVNPALPREWQSLENLASRRAIGDRLARLIQAGEPSLIDKLSNGGTEKIKSKMLAEGWSKEDALTVETITDAARYVGLAAANAVTLLSLPRVVLGGGLAEAMGESFTSLVRESFRANVFPAELRDSEVVTGELGDDAGILGAANLAQARQGFDKASAAC
jgi:glucokinase